MGRGPGRPRLDDPGHRPARRAQPPRLPARLPASLRRRRRQAARRPGAAGPAAVEHHHPRPAGRSAAVTADGAPSQNPARYCGRDFTPAELEEIRSLAASLPTRRAIADAVCDALLWRRADGRRKDMTARVALNRMAADGLITLPPPRHGNSNGRHLRHAPADGQLALPLGPAPVTATLAQIAPLQLIPVTSRAA